MLKHKFYKSILFVWLVVITILSCIALGRSFYRNIDIDMDYIGILVSLMSIIVAVLIGWQIFQALRINEDFKVMMDDFDSRKRDFDKSVDKIYQDINKYVKENNEATINNLSLVQEDYESTIEVVCNMLLSHQVDPAWAKFQYAVRIFKQFPNAKNYKCRISLEVIQAMASDIIVEKDKYEDFAKNINLEDLGWLLSFDYNSQNMAHLIEDIDQYKLRLGCLIKIHQSYTIYKK